jgi:DNA-binding MarR family transcriptional regulator
MSTQSQGSGGPATDEALAHAFAAFGPAYKRWTKTHVSEREIGYTHARALHVLQCKGPQIMSELGNDLGITPRYVTVLIDHMEDEGLVQRRRHPRDRRATLIELTDAGKQMCGTTGDEHVEAAAELLRALSPTQQEALLEAMETLLVELQRRGVCPDPHVLLHPPSQHVDG